MQLIKTTNIFKIRIVYKSGYVHDFEVYSFTIKNGEYSWRSADPLNNTPIALGVDDIAAVYQIGMRKKYSFFK